MRMFVYGSLKRGHTNHTLMQDSRFLADATTQPAYDMLDFGYYPGVIANGRYSIRGEVFTVSGDVLNVVDALEGHPIFYRRVRIPVITDTGVFPAWMYLYQGDHDDCSPVIAQGRYKAWFGAGTDMRPSAR